MDFFVQNNYQSVYQTDYEPTTPQTCHWSENGHHCGQIFPDLLHLINHLNMDHVGAAGNEENFCHWAGCKRAGAAFKAKYKLVNHIRIHTGEKPFVCQTLVAGGVPCGKKFARSENLKIHVRIHTGEKPFKCFQPECAKYFSNSSDRKKHMNVHKKGIMLCPVPECDRTYCHPSSLRKHLKTHGDQFLHLKMPDRISENTLKRKFEDSDENDILKKVKLETSVVSFEESGSDGSRGSSPQPIQFSQFTFPEIGNSEFSEFPAGYPVFMTGNYMENFYANNPAAYYPIM